MKPILNYKDSYNMHLITSYRFGTLFDQGLYSESFIDGLVYTDGYIPVASASEMNALRTSGTREMGVGSKWSGNYNTGLDKKYVVVRNISLAGYSNFTVFGAFSGIFDGNELNITNLTINNSGGQTALFTSNSGTLKNIRLSGSVTQTNASVNYVAGLCGVNTTGNIDNCRFDGTVTNAGGVTAGICGSMSTSGTISNCRSTGSLSCGSGKNTAGGIVGVIETSSCTVEKCRSSMSVDCGNYYGGGIAGRNIGGTIRECYATGNCTGSLYYVGGLVGYNQSSGVISNCWASGNAYAGSEGSGGFVGSNASGTITNCYSLGAATGTQKGGFAGANAGTITACYWNTETSGNATSAGGTGKTTSEMQTGAIPDTTIYVNWSTSYWNAGTTSEYPYLVNNY